MLVNYYSSRYYKDTYLYCIFLVNGGWTAWVAWAQACDGNTNDFEQTRTRTCTNPTPSGGGTQCPNGNTETQTCSGEFLRGNLNRKYF